MSLRELEAKIDVEELLPDLLALVADVVKALDDGKLTMVEALRLGQRFVNLVKFGRKR